MSSTSPSKIQERHQLEILHLRLQRQTEENEAALRQAKFDLRTAQQELVLYSGSFRALRDRFSGTRPETEAALHRAVEKAEVVMNATNQAGKRLTLQLAEVRRQLELLPAWDTLREQAEPEMLPEWFRLEALYCAEVLLPLLEENLAALTDRRKMTTGANPGKVYTFAEQAETLTAPEAAGEQCRPYVLRLKAALDELEIPFELHSYFDAPTAFLSSATKYTRMDRVTEAIDQVEDMQRALSKLQKEFAR